MTRARWQLAIDFGTSNTAAAHTGAGDGAILPVPLTHRSNLMSSAVFVRSADDILTGDAALNAAETHPEAFIPGPKRLIGQPFVRVAGVDLVPAQLVAAVLGAVYRRACTLHNGEPPERVVLTHPEGWSRDKVAALTDAAARAGIDPALVTTISEPSAAAHHYTRSGTLAADDAIAVFDFGGGTADVAVLRATTDGAFEVIAARGDNALGGRNFDALIGRWARTHLADTEPGLARSLTDADPGGARALRALEASARAAKEVLSEAPSATIAVASEVGRSTLVLTRDELDNLIEPQVRAAGDLVRSALVAASVPADRLRALYLTGGSSSVPLVHRTMAGLAPVATLDDPKTVVCQGALAALRRAPATRRAGGVSSRTRAVGLAAAAVIVVGAVGAFVLTRSGSDADADAIGLAAEGASTTQDAPASTSTGAVPVSPAPLSPTPGTAGPAPVTTDVEPIPVTGPDAVAINRLLDRLPNPTRNSLTGCVLESHYGREAAWCDVVPDSALGTGLNAQGRTISMGTSMYAPEQASSQVQDVLARESPESLIEGRNGSGAGFILDYGDRADGSYFRTDGLVLGINDLGGAAQMREFLERTGVLG